RRAEVRPTTGGRRCTMPTAPGNQSTANALASFLGRPTEPARKLRRQPPRLQPCGGLSLLLFPFSSRRHAHRGVHGHRGCVRLAAPRGWGRGLVRALDEAGRATLAERAGKAQRRLPLSSVRLTAPVNDPEKIICLGLNYRDHAAELGQEPPAAPLWFGKFANS